MKKIISLILGIVMCMIMTSCITEAYAQSEYTDTNVDVIITYGTPICNDRGLLVYYTYNNFYYYPYYEGNRWYFRRYVKPLPQRHCRPVPRDFYRHRPIVRHRANPHSRGVWHSRPNHGNNKGFGRNGHRPSNHTNGRRFRK